MAAVNYETKLDQLIDVSKACSLTADNTRGVLSEIGTYVASLEAEWLGPDSSAYQELMTQYAACSNALVLALDEISVGLQKNEANYSNSADTNSRIVTGITSQLPAANINL